MKYDHGQVELAAIEIGSVLLRLQRAGLTENQARRAVTRIVEMEELPVSLDEEMWDDATPCGDSSADAVKESADEEAPKTVREPSTDEDSDDSSPDTQREPKTEGWDRFMDQILLSEGHRKNLREKNLPDSPGMLHAKRYSEKAHNRIVIKK